MKLLILYLLSLLAIQTIQAQSSVDLFDCHNQVLSPSEKRYEGYAKSMDIIRLQELYANPSYAEWTHTADSMVYRNKFRSMAFTGYSNGELVGDFLPSEGNGFEDYRLGASGEFSLKRAGTLYGTVRYARGKHQNIGWSGVRHPELYAPYIATDSIGGDFHYEDYLIQGGYAFTIKKWKFGVDGEFHGEQAHRKTDPRALNKTTWLNFGLGISRMFNGHLLMLQGNYGRNKQHVNLRYWRPGEQDRFFICYGFGMYDIRRSKVAFGYSRMYYINEGSAGLTYHSPLDKPLSVYASLGYSFRHMKTEETDICDLYESRTHHLLPTLILDWKPVRTWKISLGISGSVDVRKGYENIFERYMSDEDNNIYDYRQIDQHQKYDYAKSDLLAQLTVGWMFAPAQTIELVGGVSSNAQDETYDGGDMRISHSSIFPHGKLNYKVKVKRSELNLSVLFGKKLMTSAHYEVPLYSSPRLEYLNFQQAFAPYAYYNSTFKVLTASASYLYHFRKSALGVNFKVMFADGARDKGTQFNEEIGYDSTAPMIDINPDVHKELWMSGSLFFVF